MNAKQLVLLVLLIPLQKYVKVFVQLDTMLNPHSKSVESPVNLSMPLMMIKHAFLTVLFLVMSMKTSIRMTTPTDVSINVYQLGMQTTLHVSAHKLVQATYFLIIQLDYVLKNVLKILISLDITEFVIFPVHPQVFLQKMIQGNV